MKRKSAKGLENDVQKQTAAQQAAGGAGVPRRERQRCSRGRRGTRRRQRIRRRAEELIQTPEGILVKGSWTRTVNAVDRTGGRQDGERGEWRVERGRVSEGNRAQEALAESVRRGSLGTTRPVYCMVLLGDDSGERAEREREQQVKSRGTRGCGACNWLWSLASSARALGPLRRCVLESAGAISHGDGGQLWPEGA